MNILSALVFIVLGFIFMPMILDNLEEVETASIVTESLIQLAPLLYVVFLAIVAVIIIAQNRK